MSSPKSLEKILPEKMLLSMIKMNLSTEYKFRLIPCKTISGSVLVPAFRPDKLVLKNENGEYEAEEIMVAVSENAPENTLIIGKNLILKEKDNFFRRCER